MKRFKMIISAVVLIACLVIIFNKLFAPQPIQIILETGQEVTTQNSDYYSLSEVLLLSTASLLIGITSLYLFYNSDGIASSIMSRKAHETGKTSDERYKLISPLLKRDEKTVFSALKDSNGEMLQNKLVSKTGLSKVSVTRALAKLEMKNLVIRERSGLTNKVRIKNE